MQKALVLILILVAAVVIVGCNPPAQSQTAAIHQGGSMTPDGKKTAGPTTLQAQN